MKVIQLPQHNVPNIIKVPGPIIKFMSFQELLTGKALKTLYKADSFLVVHGYKHSGKIAHHISTSLKWNHMLHISGAFDFEVDAVVKKVKLLGVSGLIAVGGGAVQDVCKAAAHRCGIYLVAIPTQIATDGVASPVAVLKSKDMRSFSNGAVAPHTIFICPDLYDSVPDRYWTALAGDIIGNLVAVRDCRKFAARGKPEELLNRIEKGCVMAETAALIVLERYRTASSRELRLVLIESALLSGQAMLVAGDSSPCSGAEHLISHAIDFMQISPLSLHGVQVGAATPLCLKLHGEEDLSKQAQELLQGLGGPTSICELDGVSHTPLQEIFELAPGMRPCRQTVLGRYTVKELSLLANNS